ncbi:MAG: hypothetical protein ACP5KO_06990 [Caldimicrobium sp.]|jgi:hypothetical protein|uniref:Uncharacterized protein n=1 Tax=Caldimicrobium thiodismutans TaxID=1653476 RepID=A0A2N7PLB3_9BACT|nr:MAG: hypothetical protein C0197_00460 [Caldimicrobium thiodismutans]
MTYKQRNSGQALFLTIIFSLLGLLLIGGLYLAYERAIKIVFPIRTYTTLREAASGTVQMLAKYIDECPENAKLTFECPQGLGSPDERYCRSGIIKFRLIEYKDVFVANATICPLYQALFPGESAEAVVSTDPNIQFSRKLVYSIIVKAYGPYGTTSTIEAVYQP